MEELKKIAEALPPIKNLDHYVQLKAWYESNEWHGVDDYVTRVLRTSNDRIKTLVIMGAFEDNKKKVGLFSKIKNKFK
jgi:hypothetical protein